jgi:hypothetical protein
MQKINNSIRKAIESWHNVQNFMEKFNNSTDEEAQQFFIKKLKESTKFIIKILERLKNDEKWKTETNKLFCLLGESLKEYILIISDVIIKITPDVTNVYIELLRTTIPAINTAITASIGTLQEIMSVTPFGPIVILATTGTKLVYQMSELANGWGKATTSATIVAKESLKAFQDNVPRIEKIIGNSTEVLDNIAGVLDVITETTNPNNIQSGGKKQHAKHKQNRKKKKKKQSRKKQTKRKTRKTKQTKKTKKTKKNKKHKKHNKKQRKKH